MERYRKGVHDKFKPKNPQDERKLLPINEGQIALVKGEFASREKETFFNDAYADILADLFVKWLSTGHHEKETREYLYSTAMALGSVKEKLIAIETYGRNVPLNERLTPPPLMNKENQDVAQQQSGFN